MKKILALLVFALTLLVPSAVAQTYEPVVYPAQQDAVGTANLSESNGTYTFSNSLFTAQFVTTDGHLMFGGCDEMNLKAGTELFVITFGDGTVVNASQMTLGEVTTGNLAVNSSAAKGAEHFPGKYLQAVHTYTKGSAHVTFTWRAELRDGSHYLRTDLTMTSDQDVQMSSIVPMQYAVDALAAGSTPAVVGNTRGAVLMSNKIFAGLETPTAYNSVVSETTVPEKWSNYGAWTADYFSWTPAELPTGITNLSSNYNTSNVVGARGYLKFETAGSQTITFTYSKGGHKLNIVGVDVLDTNGNVVDHDYHQGYTGDNQKDKVYTLDIPSAGYYQVRYFVTTLNWSEDYGDESITSEGNIAYSGTVSIPTVVFDLDPVAPASTRRKVLSADHIGNNENITDTWDTSTNQFQDMNDADVPARIVELGHTANNIYYREQDFNISVAGGTLTTTFTYKNGSNRLQIVGVDLVDSNGDVAVNDYHFGFTGNEAEGNTYKFIVPAAGQYKLRYLVSKQGEDLTSNGDIAINYEIIDYLHLPAPAEVTIQGLWSRQTTLKASTGSNLTDKDVVWNVSSVVGIVNPDHKRRSFLAYSERERAVAWRPFPHYNSWYELNINRNNADPGSENTNMWVAECTPVVEAWKTNLFDKYGVGIKSFVWDDGWDEYGEWRHHSGFPNGFKEPGEVADAMNSGIGAWLGPVGGYGGSGNHRRDYWNGKGGMQLSNKAYYDVFKAACTRLVKTDAEKYGHEFNYFKFDGISGQFSSVGPDAGATGNENAEGIIGCERYVRENLKADIFFNTTVGTWASPFWYHFSDATWRQENDYGNAGNNSSNREKWITYRDRLVYQNYVQLSPICPINALMTHGFILHQRPDGNYDGVSTDQSYKSVLNELRCAFICGSGMVELYADHRLMSSIRKDQNDETTAGALWKDLADCLKWQEKNKDVLPDAHWVGGNPWTGAKSEIYGWASWNGTKATLALRNGANAQQTFTTTLRDALDIPASCTSSVYLVGSFDDLKGTLKQIADIDDNTPISLDTEITFTLPASSVYVFDGSINKFTDASFDLPETEPVTAGELSALTITFTGEAAANVQLSETQHTAYLTKKAAPAQVKAQNGKFNAPRLKAAEAPAGAIEGNITAVAGETGKFSIAFPEADIVAGNYEVTIPAGTFYVGTEPVAELKANYTVEEAAATETVLARMTDLVNGGTNHNGVVSTEWTTNVEKGAVYDFTATSSYVGAINNDAIATALNNGTNYITVAAWVYGNGTTSQSNIFGYGGSLKGVKFNINGSTLKTTTKNVKDFPTQNASLQANQWNLVAYTIPEKSNTSATQYAYYAGTSTGNQYLKDGYNSSSGWAYNVPATQQFSIASANCDEASECFNGLLANVIVIESEGFMTYDKLYSLVGPAPTASASKESKLQNKIEALLGLDGLVGKVGYPSAESTSAAALMPYLEEVTEETYDEALAAYNAVLAETDVVLPEDGKAYKIWNVMSDGQKRAVYYLANSTNADMKTGTEWGAAAPTTEGSEDIFICHVVNGEMFFTNNTGKYMHLVADGKNQHWDDTYTTAKNKLVLAKMPTTGGSGSQMSAANVENTFGLLTIKGALETNIDDNKYYLMGTNNGKFANAQTTALYFTADAQSSAFSFEKADVNVYTINCTGDVPVSPEPTVTVNGHTYKNGSMMYSAAALTNSNVTVNNVPSGYKATISVNSETNVVTVTYKNNNDPFNDRLFIIKSAYTGYGSKALYKTSDDKLGWKEYVEGDNSFIFTFKKVSNDDVNWTKNGGITASGRYAIMSGTKYVGTTTWNGTYSFVDLNSLMDNGALAENGKSGIFAIAPIANTNPQQYNIATTLYNNANDFSTLALLSGASTTAESGNASTYNVWNTANNVSAWTLEEVQPVVPVGTHYVTFEGQDSNRPRYLYNNFTATENSDKTFQATTQGTATNGKPKNNFIWKIESDGLGNFTFLNGEGSTTIKTYKNATISSLFAEKHPVSGHEKAYFLKVNSTSNDCLNQINAGNGCVVTTWQSNEGGGSALDNLWNINEVEISDVTVYTVQVTGCDKGYVTYDGQNAKSGGFFLVSNSEHPTVTAAPVLGYTPSEVTISDNVISVTYIPNNVTYTINITDNSGKLAEPTSVNYVHNSTVETKQNEATITAPYGSLEISQIRSAYDYVGAEVSIEPDGETENFNVNVNYSTLYHPTWRADKEERPLKTGTCSGDGTWTGNAYMIYDASIQGDTNRSGFEYGGDARVCVTYQDPNKVWALDNTTGTHLINNDHPVPLTFKAGIQYLWVIENAEGTADGEVNNTTAYYLRNVANGKYYDCKGYPSDNKDEATKVYIQDFQTGTISGANSTTHSYSKYEERVDAISDDKGIFLIGGQMEGHTGSNNNGNCWNGDEEAFNNWETSSPFCFYQVVELTDAMDQETWDVNLDYAHYIDGVGDLSHDFGTFGEKTADSEDLVVGTNTFSDYVDVVIENTNKYVRAPKPGRLLTIKNALSLKYMNGADVTSDYNVMWYNSQNQIVSYNTGLGFVGVGAAELPEMDAAEFETHTAEQPSFRLGTMVIQTKEDKFFSVADDKASVLCTNDANTTDNSTWYVDNAPYVNVSFGSANNGYTTFLAPEPMIVPDGVTAYTVTKNEVEEDAEKGQKKECILTLTSIKASEDGNAYIPANTAVILQGTAGETVQVKSRLVPKDVTDEEYAELDKDWDGFIDTDALTTENVLKALDYSCVNPQYNGGTYTVGGQTKYIYTLAKGAFSYYIGQKIQAFKCFLALDNDYRAGSGNTAAFRIIFEDGTDAIHVIDALSNDDSNCFDLTGRRVQSNERGLLIKNGKKMLRK